VRPLPPPAEGPQSQEREERTQNPIATIPQEPARQRWEMGRGGRAFGSISHGGSPRRECSIPKGFCVLPRGCPMFAPNGRTWVFSSRCPTNSSSSTTGRPSFHHVQLLSTACLGRVPHPLRGWQRVRGPRMFHREVIRRVASRATVLNLSGQPDGASQHRYGEPRLDNAFVLIEGHPAPARSKTEAWAARRSQPPRLKRNHPEGALHAHVTEKSSWPHILRLRPVPTPHRQTLRRAIPLYRRGGRPRTWQSKRLHTPRATSP
jgi:hypothetical protein